MASLLERARGFRLDDRGGIRLTLEPHYFGVQPDLRDLRPNLAQLSLVIMGVPYILLMPRRKRHMRRPTKGNPPPIDVTDLHHRYWRNGERLGYIQSVSHIQSVSRAKGPDKDTYDFGLGVVPSKASSQAAAVCGR